MSMAKKRRKQASGQHEEPNGLQYRMVIRTADLDAGIPDAIMTMEVVPDQPPVIEARDDVSQDIPTDPSTGATRTTEHRRVRP